MPNFYEFLVELSAFHHILARLCSKEQTCGGAPVRKYCGAMGKAAYKIMVLAAAVLCIAGGPALARDITVLAAASLRGALDEVAALSNNTVAISYGGSGALARQVAQGAPADVVVLANPQWMDWLQEQGSVAPEAAAPLLTNTLVLIGHRGPTLPEPDAASLMARLGDGRLAIGQRHAVPAGIYARAWLEYVHAWETLEPHLAEVENVRAALALVARGDAPLGVVYGSDARAEPKVSVLWQIPADQHPPITYPAAALTPEGAHFMTTLRSPEATAIFARHGFGLP
ncbi:molybdate-binding periplasmic protein [Pseudosulfitobacter pseudonitzschiae]|uniref:Molybdate-binding periplasmic protein n=2 Tax=Rhodobacterales TaxID=204455 RepID=A0A221K1S6_9RHOB|nr:molybdate ABC transporter substrate-binding protein [Pseudosulfitobacter pseudonitzschiae]ASM72948.1 molybdate-binding periplasmic protein [Pseudosulfitobacter pseudonitzschiae]